MVEKGRKGREKGRVIPKYGSRVKAPVKIAKYIFNTRLYFPFNPFLLIE